MLVGTTGIVEEGSEGASDPVGRAGVEEIAVVVRLAPGRVEEGATL